MKPNAADSFATLHLRAIRCAAVWLAMSAVFAGCTALEPLTRLEVFDRTARDKAAINSVSIVSGAETSPERPLPFAGAVAYALANNLDIRLARLDAVIARGNLDLTDMGKLPSLLISAGYTFRNPPGSSSDKTPGDAYRTTGSAELSLSALDFGVAYLRAKSDANTVLMAEERRRRTANGIVNEVRQAYWQARLGDERLPALRATVAQISEAMARSRRVADSGLQDPLVALTFQEGLIELQRQIQIYENDVVSARARLARLLNLPPSRTLALSPDKPEDPIDALAAIGRETLEDYALATRTELRELDYTIRNRRLDVLSAYAQMLPPLRLRVARMSDSTSSLVDNQWYEEGFSVAWNVIGIFSALQRAELGRRNLASNELRRLAMSLSVMEQVGVARTQIGILGQDHRLSRDQSEVRSRIFDIRRVRLPFQESDELETVRAAVAVVAAQIREDRAYAALQKSYGDLLTALGIDQFPEDFRPDAPEAEQQLASHLKALPAAILTLPEEMARELSTAALASATGEAAKAPAPTSPRR